MASKTPSAFFMAERFRPLRILLGVLILLVVLGGTALVFLQHSGRPKRVGDHPLSALGAAVEVRFDAWGVPHVEAETDDDLARALGWLHANDRLTQMELGRRAALGRLSEVVGESAIEIDTYFRRLRFPETADHLWQSASEPSKRFLEAYAQGVNAWIETHGQRLPTGLRLLGVEIEPWQPRDSLAFVLLMARDLSFWNERPEEERFLWLRAFGVDGVRELLGEPELHVPQALVELAAATAPGGGEEDGNVAQPAASEPPAPGSNNWTIGGSRTVSGKPLLANDPHLGLFLPSVWYQVQLRSPGYQAAGMTLPGAPGVIIGRGPKVAWAFTNVMLDDHDLFFERLDASGQKVLRRSEPLAGPEGEEAGAPEDTWLAIERESQTIGIRGGGTHTIEVARTDIGPFLDADPELGLPARSLRWTAYFPADPVAALRGLAMAESPEELFEVIGSYVCPAQNLVAAFEDGTLLYTPLGRLPARRQGDGRVASPAWDPAYGWDGLRARETHPWVLRPEEDVIVTANHDIRPPGYEHPLSADFFEPFRHDRIRQRLEEREKWPREDFAAIQTDAVSLYALELLAALESANGDRPFEGDAARACEQLAGWDGRMGVEGTSVLFAYLDRELIGGVFGDESEQAGLERSVGHRDRLIRLVRGEMGQHWFDDVGTEEVEDRHGIFARALARAWGEVTSRWGEDPTLWRYGDVHGLQLDHRLDELPVYGSWARRGPYPVAGSSTTVLAFGSVWRGERQRITYGPSMRWIVDWSEPDRAWAVIPGGQSGHPGDRHYDDQVEPYLAGELHEAPWSDAAIEAATVSRLRLLP